MTGASVFDTRQLFWRARVRPLRGTERKAGYITWTIATDVNS